LVRRHGQPQTRNHDTGANYEWKPARRQINARCSTIDNCPLWMPLAVMARRKSPKPLKRLERVNGIEPSSSAWKAVALPLSYTRRCRQTRQTGSLLPQTRSWCKQRAKRRNLPSLKSCGRKARVRDGFHFTSTGPPPPSKYEAEKDVARER